MAVNVNVVNVNVNVQFCISRLVDNFVITVDHPATVQNNITSVCYDDMIIALIMDCSVTSNDTANLSVVNYHGCE